MISLSSRALGSTRSLSLVNDRVTWSNGDSQGWVAGNKWAQMSIDALFETISRTPPLAIPEEYTRSMDGLARGQIPWPLVIPQHVLGDHIRSISSAVDDALEILGDYATTLAASRRILSLLQPCRIDLHALRHEQGKSNSSALDSFEPGPDSMCQVPIYSHATSTGRLTIHEGPRILTLQKNHRRILASRFEGGHVMQVDFVSLEPRVLRLLHAMIAPIDLYADVSDRLGGAASRRQVKLATLKLLYGSSRASISEDVGTISASAIRQIEEYFGLSSLRSKLALEFGKRGIIKSHWGRPLPEATESHLFVSHFAQSTAVDVSLGGFSSILDKIIESDLDVVPCFVLHDALLIDVHPSSLNRLSEIVTEGIDIEGLGHFEVSLSPAYLDKENE